jgi:hypothetical protein
VHTDHHDLTYYQHLHKLSDHTRQALDRVLKYNMKLIYKPGILNHADELSRQPDYKTHVQPIKETGLPTHMFINTLSELDLDNAIIYVQTNNTDQI